MWGVEWQTSLNEIVEILRQLSNQPLPITYQQARLGDIKHSMADISSIQERLGYVPKTAVSEGLQKTLTWFRGK